MYHSQKEDSYKMPVARIHRCKKGIIFAKFPAKHENAVIFQKRISFDFLKGYELDVFIPSLKIGIEYDGEFYHKNSLSKDVEKSLIMLDNGIHLIRIRESNCPELIVPGVEVYTFEYSSTYEKLVPILKHIIKELCKKSNVAFELQIDIDSVRNDILSSLYTIPYEKSFSAYSHSSYASLLHDRWNFCG